MTIPNNANFIYWSEAIGDGYNFVSEKRYPLHRFTEDGKDIVAIYIPDELILNSGEITSDVAELANFE